MRITEHRFLGLPARPVVGLLFGGTLLVAIEVACRFLLQTSPPGWAPFSEAIFAGSPDLGWVLRPGFRGAWEPEDPNVRVFDARGYRAVDSAQVTDGTSPAILFIGDSTTFGFGVPDEAMFTEVVDRQLHSTRVINLAVPGYSSAQGVIVAQKSLATLRPRIAVFSFNFNDRRAAFQRPDSPEAFRAIYRQSPEYWPNRWRRVAESSATFRALAMLTDGVANRHMAETIPVDLGSAVPRVDETAYEENLREMVALSRAHGAHPVLLLLHDSPDESVPVREASAMVKRGQVEAGIRSLERFVGEHEVANLARLALADAYRQVGRESEAQAVLRITYFHPNVDGLDPVRPDWTYTDVMRRVAEQLNVDLIDAATVLDAMPDVFLDECHFDADGHRAVGALIAQRLEPLLNR